MVISQHQAPQTTLAFNEAMVDSDVTNKSVKSQNARQLQILLCGCGNAVHVLISYIAQRFSTEYDFRVNVLSSHADRLTTSLADDGKIHCINDAGDVFYGKANAISSDPAEVVPGSSIILFALPTDRHEVYLKSMLPYIQKGMMIGSMPGEGGFDLCVRNILGPDLTDKCILFSLDTLPWACRIETFGRVVRVLGTKTDVDLCVRPGTDFPKVCNILQAIVGARPAVKGSPTSNFLGVSLMNPNAIGHPCIEYGLLRDWDGSTPFAEPPLFYQGVDDFTAKTIEAASNEILQIKSSIQAMYPNVDLSLVRTIGEILEEWYYDDISDHSSLRNMFLSNKGYDGLTLPTKVTESGSGYVPLFDHRYFSEDLPCGILVQKGIAELAGVSTPTIDKVITWCQERVGKEYLVNGKLQGKDIATTKTPQRYGFTDLKTFMEVNGYS